MAHGSSARFARDDNKEVGRYEERVVAKERTVAEPRHLSNLI